MDNEREERKKKGFVPITPVQTGLEMTRGQLNLKIIN